MSSATSSSDRTAFSPAARLARNTSVPLFLLYLSVLSACFLGIIGFLRILGEQGAGQVAKVAAPTFLFIGLLYLLSLKRLRVDTFSTLCILLIFYGASLGLLGRDSSAHFFVTHLFMGSFIACCYIVGYNTNVSRASLERYLNFSSNIMLAVFLLISFSYWIAVNIFKLRIYPGLGTVGLFFTFSVALVYKRPLTALLCLATIFMSGKRGVLITAAMMFVVYAPFGSRYRLGLKLVGSGFILCVLAAGSFMLEPLLNLQDGGAFARAASKWFQLNPLRENFDPLLASSGRLLEILLAWENFASDWWSTIFGLGYGWSYFFDAKLPWISKTDYYVHYVHFSPLNFIFQYGIVLGLAFLWFFWRRISMLYRGLAENGRDPVDTSLFLILFAYAFIGLFGFSYGQEPIIWLLLGLLSRRNDDSRERIRLHRLQMAGASP